MSSKGLSALVEKSLGVYSLAAFPGFSSPHEMYANETSSLQKRLSKASSPSLALKKGRYLSIKSTFALTSSNTSFSNGRPWNSVRRSINVSLIASRFSSEMSTRWRTATGPSHPSSHLGGKGIRVTPLTILPVSRSVSSATQEGSIILLYVLLYFYMYYYTFSPNYKFNTFVVIFHTKHSVECT